MAETLVSIIGQTDQHFRVYVCDNVIPEPIEEIVQNSVGNNGKIIYYRFESNPGRYSLVQYWEQFIRLSNETWIWLFSDDDIMNSRCVESFL